MSRLGLAVPNIFATQGSGPTPVSQLDTNFSTGAGWLSDSSNGYGYYLQDSGTANNYIVAYPSGLIPSGLTNGMWFVMNPVNTNSSTSVITVNTFPAVSIVNPAGLALSGGEINANSVIPLMYTGSNFIIAGSCGFYKNLSGLSANQTFNVAGYSSVSLQLAWGSGTNLTTTLSNMSSGVPVSLTLVNNTAVSTGFGVGITNPAGAALTVLALASGSTSGAGFINLGGGAVIGSNAAMCFNGVSGISSIVFAR